MVVFSAVAHVGLLGLVLTVPGDRRVARPRSLSVELVSLPPGAPKARPKPAAPAPPEPAVAPAPPPPPPKPKAVVLPEKPRGPKPAEKAKRRREVFIEPKPKKEEKSLDELLSEMREDAGEPAETPAAPVDTAVADAPGPSGAGEPVSAEVLDWVARAKRAVRRAWVVPPGFRNEPLETHVVITLDAQGNVIGTPSVTKRSGNPWFDQGVVRGIAKASPLPPPPEPGDWDFIFVPEDSL